MKRLTQKPSQFVGDEVCTIMQNNKVFPQKIRRKTYVLPGCGGWTGNWEAGSGVRLAGGTRVGRESERQYGELSPVWRTGREHTHRSLSRSYFRLDRKIQTPNTNNIEYFEYFEFMEVKKKISPTCKSKRWHPLELWLLEPFPHSSECFSARLELRPGFWVAEQIRERALTAA